MTPSMGHLGYYYHGAHCHYRYHYHHHQYYRSRLRVGIQTMGSTKGATLRSGRKQWVTHFGSALVTPSMDGSGPD